MSLYQQASTVVCGYPAKLNMPASRILAYRVTLGFCRRFNSGYILTEATSHDKKIPQKLSKLAHLTGSGVTYSP